MNTEQSAKYKSSTALGIYIAVTIGALIVALVGVLYIAVQNHNVATAANDRAAKTDHRLNILEDDLDARRAIRVDTDKTVNQKLEKLRIDQRNQFCAVLTLLGPDPRDFLKPIKVFLKCPKVNPLLPPPGATHPSPSAS